MSVHQEDIIVDGLSLGTTLGTASSVVGDAVDGDVQERGGDAFQPFPGGLCDPSSVRPWAVALESLVGLDAVYGHFMVYARFDTDWRCLRRVTGGEGCRKSAADGGYA